MAKIIYSNIQEQVSKIIEKYVAGLDILE